MKPILLSSKTQTEKATGVLYHAVYLKHEVVPLHFHDYYEIILVISDGVIHVVNGEKQLLKKGSLLFIRKQDTHTFEYGIGGNVSFLNFAFTEEVISSLFFYLSNGFCFDKLLSVKMPPIVVLTGRDISYVKGLFDELSAFPPEDVLERKYQSRIVLFKIFTKFFSAYKFIEQQSEENMPFWLVQFDKEMHKIENFSEKAEHMVKLSGKCQAYLGRMLKKYFGITATEYLNNIRLQYLANMLSSTDIPILDLCYECGYNNISWAYTLFKEKFGVTPLAYRNNHK